jgi:endogenous inhibitor of DNA gyrase (YacG/DUF329 family)
MQVKCPTCKKLNEYEGNEYRPFCSKRCKLIDLGEWASGSYAIPVEDKSHIDQHPDSDEFEGP